MARMSRFISLLLLFNVVCIHLSSGETGTPFLKFRKIETATQRNGSFSYFGNHAPIVVDAMFPRVTIQIVELINNVPPKLQFHCVVEKLSVDSPLTSAQLCYETPSSRKPICDSAIGNSYLLSDKYKFKATGDVYNGYTFSSNWDRDKLPLDANYWCRLGNNNGVIESNVIEVQDMDSYTTAFLKRSSVDPQLLDPLVGSSFPKYLPCGSPLEDVDLPKWAKDNFPVPYSWMACEAEPDGYIELRKCYDRSQPIGDYLEHTVTPNGTLIIHDLVNDWRPIGILCSTSEMRNKIYSAYFQNNNGKSAPFSYIDGTYPNNIIPLSPQNNHVSVRSGWHARDVISLNAAYTANPKTVSAKWSKDGGSTPLHFTANRHSLVFPQDIKPSYAGTYILSLRSPYETLQFKYEVVVEQPPTIKEPPPRHIIVPQGNQAQLTTEFEGHLTSRSVLINGIRIDQLMSSGYQDSLTLLKEAFPYVGDINFEIDYPADTSIRYTVRDLAFSPNSPYGSSHIVSMVASNSLGSVGTNTLIRVLPKPDVIRQLSDYSCVEDCFNHTTHRFYCEIDMAPFTGLRVVKTWELDGHDLERLGPRDDRHLFLNYSKREVVLSIPKDNDQFDELFSNVVLTCRYRVFGPLTDLFPGEMYETPYYDTKNDPDVSKLLTAYIRKDPSKAKLVIVASISWIVAVVIAVLILLIVAILATCIVMRNKGKTYLLEREERIRGNDPEKEFRDRDAFQAYERQDELPIPGLNQSLEDSFQVAGSDDEGEFDYCGMDPGNFNETGSFIDEYSRSSRRTDLATNGGGNTLVSSPEHTVVAANGGLLHSNSVGPV